MKTLMSLFLSVGLCLLVGCASDPMKPSRPEGKRVPINRTPPPISQPAAPAAPARMKQTTQGDSGNG